MTEIEILSDAVEYARSHAQLFFGVPKPSVQRVLGECLVEALERGSSRVVVSDAGSGWWHFSSNFDYFARSALGVAEFRRLVPQPERGFRATGMLLFINAFSNGPVWVCSGVELRRVWWRVASEEIVVREPDRSSVPASLIDAIDVDRDMMLHIVSRWD